MKRARIGNVVWLALLCGLLGLHFQSRLSAHLSRPASERHIYSRSYVVSLSLLTGHGFVYLLPAAAADGESLASAVERLRMETLPAAPVMDFLSGRGRLRLAPEELRAFLAAGTKPVAIGTPGTDSQWETTRVLDLHVAALVWRLFGVSWVALFAFYALASTAACAAVVAVAASLTGSRWGGLVGGLSFALSPLERGLGAWSFRDASPLWFAAFTFAALVLWAPTARSLWRSCAGWAAIGMVSLLGVGFRPDAYLLPPVALAGLAALLLARREPVARIAVAVCAFAAGALAARAAIAALGPETAPAGSAGFHIAWYGDEARSNRLGAENVFQAQPDDRLVVLQGNFYRRHRPGATSTELPATDVYDPRHLVAARALYFEMARYHAHTWWLAFPGFLAGLARVDASPVPPHPMGLASPTPRGGEDPPARALRAVLALYLAATPWFAALGAAWALVRPASRVLALLLAAFFAYYGAVLMAVLPEAKHWAPLLLPLHVLSAAFVCFLLVAAVSRVRGVGRRAPADAKDVRLKLALAGAAVSWIALGTATYYMSRSQRQRFVRGIAELPRVDLPIPMPEGSKLYTIRVPPASATRGYLLRVRAGRRPAELFAVHVRDSRSTPLYYYTRHAIAPERAQGFFVAPVAGAAIGETRPYTLHLRIRGSATFSSVEALDLDRWTVAVPLALVFEEGERRPGTARIRDGLPLTASLASPEAVSELVGAPRPER